LILIKFLRAKKKRSLNALQSSGKLNGFSNGGCVMDKFVARLNIEHYRKQLATEQDETKRRELLRLLVEEEAKLAALCGQSTRKRWRT